MVEIKCPYCARDKLPSDGATDGSIDCLEKNAENECSLRREHAYYYQVQAQLNICKVDFCDFIVWMFHGMHVEHIFRDADFLKKQWKKLQPSTNIVSFQNLLESGIARSVYYLILMCQ